MGKSYSSRNPCLSRKPQRLCKVCRLWTLGVDRKNLTSCQEIVQFREILESMMEKNDPVLSTFPEDNKPLIAKLAHERCAHCFDFLILLNSVRYFLAINQRLPLQNTSDHNCYRRKTKIANLTHRLIQVVFFHLSLSKQQSNQSWTATTTELTHLHPPQRCLVGFMYGDGKSSLSIATGCLKHLAKRPKHGLQNESKYDASFLLDFVQNTN